MSTSSPATDLARLVRDGRRYWASPAGQAVWQAERACLGPVCERLFGAHSLELGMTSALADMCPVRHAMRWAPTRELVEQAATLVCPPDALPLRDDSLSLVVIHHLLEVLPDPHHMLQEAARVTADDGRLIIFGWVPLGPAGLSRAWPGRLRRLPWRGHWRTPGRLKDWLAFVDFEIERVDYCGFHLPGSLPRNAMLETLGRRHNLPLGDSYMIYARRKPHLAQTQRSRLSFARPLGGSALGGATRLGPPRIEPEQERMTEGD
ncbi:class I SAM-dependent methyltransferase [Halomonas kalidii]|uniref:Methyltransferase domain-containing protein n=1 Tax=Halomonas kalidii TaxID=3043293 RepID=A0ABT6VFY0_9GAMM|nr:methyltransferase domain-containing protein [Halomonas kalidii]MDI5932891.1 methyltransferase domain-containing protein [Halomonas kalidii]